MRSKMFSTQSIHPHHNQVELQDILEHTRFKSTLGKIPIIQRIKLQDTQTSNIGLMKRQVGLMEYDKMLTRLAVFRPGLGRPPAK